MAYPNNYKDDRIRRLINSSIERDSKRTIRTEEERQMMNDYRNSHEVPTSSYTSTISQPDLKIEVLTEENKELKKKYGVLLKKTTLILEEYKKQEADIKNIKIRLAKREKNIENIANVKEIAKNIYKKIIVWFST